VTVSDLTKLFSKCGPLISASFDMNNFKQYLGSATIVYATTEGASRARKDYNGAMLDDRVMTVEYAQPLMSG
jgi:RNA recognition motif-containing protein